MGIEIILFMVILLLVFFVMNTFAKRSQQKRQDAQKQMLEEQLVPGAWVQTYSGFFGRYVDQDGDVIILETPSGEETYWVIRAIRSVEEPPFEALQIDEDVVETSSGGQDFLSAEVEETDVITPDDDEEGK